MAKNRAVFLCNQCGATQAKWNGKCPDCGTWDSLEPYTPPTDASGRATTAVTALQLSENPPQRLREVTTDRVPRLPTGISEFDRVLGGGLVPGSVTLVGGEPGIGKSTLLLQVAQRLCAKPAGKPGASVLYVTAEESASQTKLRATRLFKDAGDLLVLAETNLERITHQAALAKADVMVVDSMQMIHTPDLPAAPGSVTQLRETCLRLVRHAKTTNCAVLLVGHVTKAGTLAGPKLVEHIVDVVVSFEGDRYHAHRIVRCTKNRFGSTAEVGLFEMTDRGLTEVADPSQLLAEHLRPGERPTSGVVYTAALTGSRVLLAEVQALTASSVIGAAKRKVSGVPSDRVAMIIAILEKRMDMRLAAEDVFVNVVGGIRIAEPAADLAVALAIASAHQNRPLPPGTLAVGELGLGGEVRPVSQLELRLKEAARLGVGHCVVPPMGNSGVPKLGGMALHEVRRLSQAMSDLTSR